MHSEYMKEMSYDVYDVIMKVTLKDNLKLQKVKSQMTQTLAMIKIQSKRNRAPIARLLRSTVKVPNLQ